MSFTLDRQQPQFKDEGSVGAEIAACASFAIGQAGWNEELRGCPSFVPKSNRGRMGHVFARAHPPRYAAPAAGFAVALGL